MNLVASFEFSNPKNSKPWIKIRQTISNITLPTYPNEYEPMKHSCGCYKEQNQIARGCKSNNKNWREFEIGIFRMYWVYIYICMFWDPHQAGFWSSKGGTLSRPGFPRLDGTNASKILCTYMSKYINYLYPTPQACPHEKTNSSNLAVESTSYLKKKCNFFEAQ